MPKIVYYIEFVGKIGDVNERDSVRRLGPFNTAPKFDRLGDYVLPNASHGEGRVRIGMYDSVVFVPYSTTEEVLRCDYMRVVAEVQE